MLAKPRTWLAGVLLMTVLAAATVWLGGDRLGVAGYTTPGAPSTLAGQRLHALLGYDAEPGMVILARPRATADGFQASVLRFAARVRADPAVGAVQTPFGAAGLPILLSRDHHAALLLVHFRSTDVNRLSGPVDRLRGFRDSGVSLSFGGYVVGELELNQIARHDLITAELIAFPLLALLTVLLFRGLFGAAIPLVIGGLSVLGTVAGLGELSRVFNISVFALNLAVLLGLGLAVDYALLLVSRYREEVAEHGHGAGAARATLVTAGRTVLFSGSAVAGACASLLVFPQSFVYSMGLAGAFVAVLAAGLAVCVTIPVLVLAGGRIAARPARPRGQTAWYRGARWVMRHPADLAIVGLLLLVAAGAPGLRARLSFPDLQSVPPGVQARTVADVVARDFTRNLEYPVTIVVASPAQRGPRSAALTLALNTVGGVAAAGPVRDRSRRIVAIQAVLSALPLSDASQQLVERARASPNHPLVAGRTAQFLDLKHSIKTRAWLAALLAAVVTFLVLFGLTRSVVLPLKALVFHALVLAATLGLLVLLFQKQALGLAGLISYRGPPTLDITIIVIIVASTFGLAADYSILLLARVSEEHRGGHADEEAIALAVERTGPVITSAALLLCVALLALTSSKLFLIKQLTIGQVIGVALDVSLVRLVLVPAFMRVLGPLNWWAPRFARSRTSPTDPPHTSVNS